MNGHRALARNRDFTALWVGQTISELGSRVTMFVFPLVVFAMTGSALLAALAEASYLLGMAVALLPAGVLADRLDRRRVMRAASGSGVLLYGSLAVSAYVDHLTLPHLFGVALLTGVGAGAFMPAETSAVRDVVATDDLPTALAQNQGRQHVAGLVGGPLGGALYGVSRVLPFAADAVSFAVSWVLIGRIRADLSPRPATGPRRSMRADLAEGARFVLGRPFFRTLLVFSSLVNLTMNALFFVAVLRLVQAGVEPVHIGLVETAGGVAGILGAIAAPWLIDRCRTGALTVAVAWSMVPLVVPMALWNDPAIVAAALAVILLLNPAGNAGMGAYRIAVTPPELIGRTQSFTQFVSMAALPLAPLIAGAALAGLGGRTAILLLGALTALVALIPTLSPHVRAVPRPREWQAELAAQLASATGKTGERAGGGQRLRAGAVAGPEPEGQRGPAVGPAGAAAGHP